MSKDHLEACLAQIAQANDETLSEVRVLNRLAAQVRKNLEDMTARLSALDDQMADLTTNIATTFSKEFGEAMADVGTGLETRFDRIDLQLEELIDLTMERK